MEPNIPQSINFTREIILHSKGLYPAPAIKVTPSMADFQIIRKLGEGSFGAVFEAKTSLFKEEFVALKCIMRIENAELSKKEANILIHLQNQLQHTNIIKLIGAFYHYQPIMVFEIAKCNIFDFKPTAGQAFQILKGLIRGLEFIHGHGYVHCDLKPDNLLICGGQAKVADLGAMTKFDKEKGATILPYHKGTYEYAPKETLAKRIASPSTDLYSLAISIYEAVYQGPFLAERGTWLKKMLNLEKNFEKAKIKYYLLVHEHGRFVEKNNDVDPICGYADEDLKAAHLLQNPTDFRTQSLEVRMQNVGHFSRRLQYILEKMSAYSKPQITSATQFWKLREAISLTQDTRNVTLCKDFPSSKINRSMAGFQKVPKTDIQNVKAALEFYYINKAELKDQGEGSGTANGRPVKKQKINNSLGAMRVMADNVKKVQKGGLTASQIKKQTIKPCCVRLVDCTAKIENKISKPNGKGGMLQRNIGKKMMVRKVRKVRVERPSRRLSWVVKSGKIFYKCKVCQKVFRHKQGLITHNKVHRTPQEQCIHCKEFFARKDVRNKHVLICNENPEGNVTPLKGVTSSLEEDSDVEEMDADNSKGSSTNSDNSTGSSDFIPV